MEEPRTKRVKAAAACLECRSRKLSCDGARPCARCQRSDRDCTDGELSTRSPLTRRHMTELEDRLQLYESLWTSLFPDFSLEEAVQAFSAHDLKHVDSRLIESLSCRLHGQPSGSPFASSQPVEQVTSPFDLRPQATHTLVPDASTSQDTSRYPPTRASSPQALSLVPVYPLVDVGETSAPYGWVEADTAYGNPSTGGGTTMDGMGASETGESSMWRPAGSAGYVGLSSADTLLRAIRKIAPGLSAASTSPTDLANLFGINQEFRSGIGQHADITGPTLAAPIRPAAYDRLPPASHTRPLIESYFRYFHTLTPIVHEPTVRAQMSGALPTPKTKAGQMLIYMIFAMGAFDIGVGEASDTAQSYFETARTIFRQTLLDEGSIELVQALAIMGNYLQRRDTPNSGYMCLGLAIRMATALGLHNPSARRGPSPLDDEMRHRIWWGLVTLEAGCSLTFGRPPMLGYASFLTSRIPANVDDEDLGVGTMQPAQESSSVTLYSAVITQARLAKVTFFLQDRLARSLPAPTVAQIQWCGEYFHREVALLRPGPVSPDEPFALARAVQAWRMRDYQSVIYRPVFLASAWDPQSRSDADPRVKIIISSCRTLATENIRDISLFAQRSDDHHRGCEWYILYFAFQACLTLLLSIVREPTNPDAEVWRKDVEDTIRLFQQMTSKGKIATSYARFMEKVLAERPTPAPRTEQPPNSAGVVADFDFERYLGEIWSNENTDPFGAFSGLYAVGSGDPAQLDPSAWTGIN